MGRLTPASFHFLPVHPGTVGYDKQRLVVEKHVFSSPKPCQRRLAFLFSHSSGFHKESFHPIIRSFVEMIRKQAKYDHTDVDIIAWDSRTHGDSARLNEGTFSSQYSWFDHAMDTKQVVTQMRLKEDYDKLVGVGHSFGGTCMLLCEFLYPNTFDGYCLIEPVLMEIVFDEEVRRTYPSMASARRRDTWANREECMASLRKRGFWRSFDPEALELYVNYGMYETPEGTIKLKCPREQEYHVFKTEYYASCTTFHALPHLSPPIHFVYATDSPFLPDGELEGRMGHCSNRCTFVYLEGSHMVPYERPPAIAQEILVFLDRFLKQDQVQVQEHKQDHDQDIRAKL